MFDEFLECTKEEDEKEIVTIVCCGCTMQATLGELRDFISFHENVFLEFLKEQQKKITPSDCLP